MPDSEEAKLTLLLMNEGKYPLYNIQVTIFDGELFTALMKNSDNVPRDMGAIFDQSKRIIKVGDLGVSQLTEIGKFDLDPKVGTRNLTMYLLARNGQVNEEMHLRWIKGNWSVAFKAYNETGVLKENVTADYPRDQLWK